MKLLDTAYRLALYALPADLRRTFGADMVQLFQDQRRSESGHPMRIGALWLGALGDVGASAAAERWRRSPLSSMTVRFPIMRSFMQDVRHGFRLLRRQPSFSIVAVLVLALGIGANTAVFSLINTLLLKPLPGSRSGDLVQLFSKDTQKPDTFRAFSYPNYVDLRARTDVFAQLAAHNFAMAGIEDHGRTRRIFIDVVSANFFSVFGQSLPIGRTFTAEEEKPGADLPVAVLSYPAWQRMGGTADVLGKTVRINARLFTVVGVAPQGFGGSMALVTPDMWVPTGMYDRLANDFSREGLTGTLASRDYHTLILVAQLQPGATATSIEPGLNLLSAEFAKSYPSENKDQSLIVRGLSRLSVSTSPDHEAPIAAVAAALLSMSGVVLMIACFNLANMLLARGASRRREFAVRSAIGGGRWRLARQLLVEGFVLALAGAAVGLVLSVWSTGALAAGLSRFSPVALSFDALPDLRVLAATMGFCAVATILFSLGPALGLARADALPGLKDRPGDVGSGRRRLRLQHVLVMGQLALSLVMVTVGGLFLRSAWQSTRLDPGFSFDRGMIVHVDAALGGLDTARVPEAEARLLEALRRRPDLTAVGAASIIPFGDVREGASVQRPGPELLDGDPGLVDSTFTIATAHYFDALGLPFLAGRDFTAAEERVEAGEPVAIIDQPLAAKLFQALDPIGQTVQYSVRTAQKPLTMRVVGVVPGVRQDAFDTAATPHIYVPLGQHPRTGLIVHMRSSAPSAEAEAALLPSIRRTVEDVDKGLAVLAAQTLSMYRDENLVFAMIRLSASIFLTFGAVALVLAMVGVYGVKAYVVSNRTREIGIRIALGATPSSVVWTVVREGFTLAMTGLAAGIVLSILAGMGMKALTFGNRGADVIVLGGAVIVLAAASIAAGWIPAKRASRVEPTQALRTE